MWSKGHGAPWGILAIVVILTKVVSTFRQKHKGAVFVQAVISATQLEILKGRENRRYSVIAGAAGCTKTDAGASLSLEEMRKLLQTLNPNHIGIFHIVPCGKSISFQPERSPLLHNSCQLLTSQFRLLHHHDTEAKAELFARVLSPLGDVELPTAAAYTNRLLFTLHLVDPLEAAKQAVKAAL